MIFLPIVMCTHKPYRFAAADYEAETPENNVPHIGQFLNHDEITR